MALDTFPLEVDTIAQQCVALRLRVLNRVVTRIYDEALRPLGIKTSQLNILVAAGKLGLASPLRVCSVLHLDPSTLSRSVERMRARGWLEVVPVEDAREQPFRLTGKGRKLLEQAGPLWETAQEQVRQLLGEGVVERLGEAVQCLSRVNETT
jgi:DNA-binding MarR family transcriptional regulator